MNILAPLFFPLVNAGTYLFKTKLAPRVPHWALPIFNILLGTGIAYAGSQVGIPGLDANSIAGNLADGVAMGTAASAVHNIKKNIE